MADAYLAFIVKQVNRVVAAGVVAELGTDMWVF